MIKDVFAALSDPVRLKIVEILKDGDLTQKELRERLGISQPSLSYHMDRLIRSGVVISVKRGRNVVYSLDMGVLEMAVEFLIRLRKERGGKENA